MQELRLAGNMPEKELSFKLSLCRRRRRPRLSGISPWNQLKLRSSVSRNVRFPRAGESAPVSPVPFKLSATTRAGLPWLHVTPSRLQKSALLFQEASEPPSLTCALKASNAASSPAPATAIIRTARSGHIKLMTPIAMLLLVPDIFQSSQPSADQQSMTIDWHRCNCSFSEFDCLVASPMDRKLDLVPPEMLLNEYTI